MQLEFELVYYDVVVHHVNHYVTEPPSLFLFEMFQCSKV